MIKREPDISIIVPFLNEKENLIRFVKKLEIFCQKNKKIFYEMVFVDDGSKDGSSEFLEKLKFKNCRAKIVKLSKNFGSHCALRAGMLHAKARLTTFMYPDLQDPLELIDKLYKKCNQGIEIVYACRISTKEALSKKFFSKIYAFFIQKFAVSEFPEKGFDIAMFVKRVREEMNANIEANSSVILQLLSLGFRKAFINYKKEKRLIGKSKWTIAKKIKILIDSFVAFSYAPLKIITVTGIVMSILGFLWAFYVVYLAIFLKEYKPGWPSLISILMIGFGITNISLGIIAEYLWRTLDVARGRKAFIIDTIKELHYEK